MPKLYGKLISEDKMKVEIVSYSGNKPGFVEVDEVLEGGEGDLHFNPITKEQWFEVEPEVVEDPVVETEVEKE